MTLSQPLIDAVPVVVPDFSAEFLPLGSHQVELVDPFHSFLACSELAFVAVCHLPIADFDTLVETIVDQVVDAAPYPAFPLDFECSVACLHSFEFAGVVQASFAASGLAFAVVLGEAVEKLVFGLLAGPALQLKLQQD